jgi:PAS domain S-box-containing protein
MFASGSRSMSPAATYGVAFLSVALAFVVRWLLDPFLGSQLQLGPVYGAIAIAVWFGGWRPALAATIIGYIGAQYLFVDPRYTLDVGSPRFYAGMVGYCLSCGIIVYLGEALRRTTEWSRQSSAQVREVLDALPAAVYTTDAEGYVTHFNSAAISLAGRNPQLGKDKWCVTWKLYRPDGTPLPHDACPMAIAIRENRPVRGAEVIAERIDGSRFWFAAYPTPLRDAEGRIVGGINMLLDITERKNAENAFRETSRRLEIMHRFIERRHRAESLNEIYNSAIDTILETLECDRVAIRLRDEDGVIRFVAWRRLSDEYRRVVEGRAPWEPDEPGRKPTCISDVDFATFEEELKSIVSKEGIRALASIPLISEGKLIGKFITYYDEPHVFGADEIDVSVNIAIQLALGIERKTAEQNLQTNEERLRLATQTGKVGIWEWDIERNHVSWTDSLYTMHGVHKSEFSATIQGFAALVHPEDREAISIAVDRSLREGVPYEISFRTIKPSGEIVWIFTNAIVLRKHGKPVRMLGATTDITELKQAEEALYRAKSEAEQANRAKDRFLAMLSHELRTPLTPVLMAAAALEDNPQIPENVRDQISMVRRNAELEARLIDDLLDLSRITYGKLTLRKQNIDVHQVLEHALGIAGTDVHAKKLQVTKQFEALRHFSFGDPARLQEVFWNIVRNAVKFTPERGCINISTANEGDEIVIRFRDTGIGIGADLKSRIFEPFEQGDPPARQRESGLGLGLAISKRIVDLHNGKIAAHSDGAGRGSTFTVRLHALAEDEMSSPKLISNRNAVASPSPAKILLVEDHADTAIILRRLLEKSGHTVSSCTSVAAAWVLAANETFDLVISDLALPDGSGCDLMQHLNNSYGLRGIALSGFGTHEDFKASREAGFAAHLTKPVDVAQLRATIADLVSTPSKIATN